MKYLAHQLTHLKKHKQRVVSFMIFALFLFQIPAPNIYFNDISASGGLTLGEEISLPAPPAYPINVTNMTEPLVSAQGVYIVDIPSNVTIYQKNGQESFTPASTTKIVTALVALDKFNLEDVLDVKTVISQGRTMGLHRGEKLTFEALLYGTLIHSANDAAYTIAENYTGAVEAFVIAMNKKISELGLTNTHFTNPIGFDDPSHITTPADLATLAKVAMKNKVFSKIVGTKSITVSDITYTYFHELRNVNELLGKISGVSGVKTGFTENAGEVLVSQLHKDGRNVLFVVLKSQDRFADTSKLIDWVFNNFQWKPIQQIIPTTAPQ